MASENERLLLARGQVVSYISRPMIRQWKITLKTKPNGAWESCARR